MHCFAGLTLTCRAEWQCAPPSRPRCSSSRDGGVAAVCQHLRSSGHSHCGLPDSLWSGGHSLFWSLARWTRPLEPGKVDAAFGAWTATIGVLPQKTLLGLSTAPGTCQVHMISASSALSSVCAATQVVTLELLCCRCSICCCCYCNNLFLGCYMATRPRRASCPRL